MSIQKNNKYQKSKVFIGCLFATIAAILIVSLVLITHIEKSKALKDVEVLEHDWEFWDGVRTQYMDLPAKGPFTDGKDIYSFSHSLNELKSSSTILYFKTHELNFKIYIDGKLLFISPDEYDRFSNVSSYLVTIPQGASLMEIRFDRSEGGSYYNVPKMVCGSLYSIICYILFQGAIYYVFIFALLLIGFSMIVMYMFRSLNELDDDRGYLCLGTIMMIIAFALYPVTDFASIMSFQSKTSFYLDFTFFALLPLSYSEYVAYRANGNKKAKIIHYLSMLFVIFPIAIIILDATNVIPLFSSLPVIYVSIIASFIACAIVIIEEIFKKKNEPMYFVGTAYLVMCLISFFGIIVFNSSLDNFIACITFGLFVYCVICGYYEIKRSVRTSNNSQKSTSWRMDKLETVLYEVTNLFESRDGGMRGHVRLVSEYTKILATYLKNSGKYTDVLSDDYIQKLADCSALHDLGKITIDEKIIVKKGKLDADEYREMQTHTANGGVIAGELLAKYLPPEDINLICDIIVCHHEWWDGSGYPSRLSHEDIPLSARIVALADVLDALTSPRYYKTVYDFEKATQIIKELSGSHFDPTIVTAFLNCREEIEAARARYVEMYE